MSELNEYTTIIKDTASRNDLDFDFLREQGIKYIEALGSKLWTDYNSHDPGITMLEVLSYADQGNESQARNLFPEVVETDWDIKSESEAEATMRDTLNKLMDIREQYNLPRVCA